jgi:hypothetical protein
MNMGQWWNDTEVNRSILIKSCPSYISPTKNAIKIALGKKSGLHGKLYVGE